MGSCVLVGAVDFNVEHFKQQTFDYVIAVDAGYSHLREAGIVPDLVIGDFDSLGKVPDHPHIQKFPCKKDQSDIEIALYEAVKRGYDELIVYGCLGGRLDFTYAMYQLIVHFAETNKRIYAIGKEAVVTGLAGEGPKSISFDGRATGTLSLFSASEELIGVDEVGLAYPLTKARLQNDKPLGVSNAFQGEASQISIEQGTALLFFPVTAWDSMTQI